MQLIEELKEVQLENENYMVSFDIQSLYTNVPVNEAINIIIDQYRDDGLDRNMEKKDLKEMLKHATDNSYFIFNEEYYKQNYGPTSKCTSCKCIFMFSRKIMVR